MPKKKTPTGAVIYRGPSMLDGAPIVAIAIFKSKNVKTGNMVQTHILREDMMPTEAVSTGADSSICGACPHRGNGDGSGRTCYVTVFMGPNQVYRAYKKGNYPVADDLASIGRNRKVRLGAYGDPAAVPASVWRALISEAKGHTGYTHQWQTASPDHAQLCMASVDSPVERSEAKAKGYRTFRVAVSSDDAPKLKGEAVCPASAEAGNKLSCATCMACDGANGKRGDITIRVHGGHAVMANAKRMAIAVSLQN